MSTTLVTLAADYVSGLIVQGIAPSKAFDHAKQRFGIDREAIRAEIDSRHSFSLAASYIESIMADAETFAVARRWIDGDPA